MLPTSNPFQTSPPKLYSSAGTTPILQKCPHPCVLPFWTSTPPTPSPCCHSTSQAQPLLLQLTILLRANLRMDGSKQHCQTTGSMIAEPVGVTCSMPDALPPHLHLKYRTGRAPFPFPIRKDILPTKVRLCLGGWEQQGGQASTSP